MNKKEIIAILEEIGTLLELKGENPFKSRAYFNAARILENRMDDIQELILSKKIAEIKGFGQALVDKLYTLVSTGELPYYIELKNSVPAGLFDLLKIPGLGPKKVKTLYDKLNITSTGELEYACKENRLRDLQGFGQKSQDKILEGIRLREKYNERFLYPAALLEAENLLGYLGDNKKIEKMELAGSLRRKRETVKDIDIIASCRDEDREIIMEYFTRHPNVDSITGQGNTKSSIVLNSGMAADLRLVSPQQFAFALHHFTGSKEHNTAMRQRAKTYSLTMNEYGLFPADDPDSLAAENEKDIFKALNLSYISPEIRENTAEIEAAEKNELPELVSDDQIRGIFHVHSTYSDGAATIKELALACKNMGFEYLGISDHSKSAFYANGLSEKRIKQQHEEIDLLNEEFSDFHIFKGIEADILSDGQLDYTDDVLESFDFVIASVHTGFRQSETDMTDRICRAIKHTSVTMLGHPTGRLLLGREAYALNMEKILETSAEYDKIIEINANPHRLDLDWREGKRAVKLGIKTSINPDAHSLEGLNDVKFGIGIARKAWFAASSIINTFTLDEVCQLFKQE